MGSSAWYLLASGAGHFAWNMALDEALLEAMPRLQRPVLRLYAWIEPAASFGYFQKHAQIERLTSLRPLVRRPTAGGLVPHDADWTYSLAFPTSDAWYALTAKQSYRRVHEWIQAALRRLAVDAELAPGQRAAGPGQCFAGYEESDVLWHGRKIAGAAQRRTRHGLLIQGSVQPPAAWSRPDWERALCQVAESDFGVRWQVLAPDNALETRARELAAQKYSQSAYNRKR